MDKRGARCWGTDSPISVSDAADPLFCIVCDEINKNLCAWYVPTLPAAHRYLIRDRDQSTGNVSGITSKTRTSPKSLQHRKALGKTHQGKGWGAPSHENAWIP